MTATTYVLKAPCQFLVDFDDLMEIAAGIGQEEGRDYDWAPKSLDEAILEILLFGQTSKDTGVLFLPSDTPQKAAYRASIHLELEHHPTAIRNYGKVMLPTGWRGTLDNTLMVLLNSGDSPADYGVHVDDTGPGAISKHQTLTGWQAVAAFKQPAEICPVASIFAKAP
jgi:hypothetical protein